MTDLLAIDSVFRLLHREVWILTAADGQRRGGLVATWVSQASLDPDAPMVLAGLAPNHFTAELVEASGAFAAHLISAAQIQHAWNFALGSGRARDKLAGVETFTAATGSPVLRDCLAWLDCRVFARLASGDRTYFWADVVAGQRVGQEKPLTDQELLAAADVEQRQQLGADRQYDIQLQGPLQKQWRDNLPSQLQPRQP